MPNNSKTDNINPQHYKQMPIEAIEVTQLLQFVDGNVFKYIYRAPYKGVEIEDLKKAAWYATFAATHPLSYASWSEPPYQIIAKLEAHKYVHLIEAMFHGEWKRLIELIEKEIHTCQRLQTIRLHEPKKPEPPTLKNTKKPLLICRLFSALRKGLKL